MAIPLRHTASGNRLASEIVHLRLGAQTRGLATVSELRHIREHLRRLLALHWRITLNIARLYSVNAKPEKEGDKMVVLLERIELSTSSLPMTRSTTELQQPDHFDALATPAV